MMFFWAAEIDSIRGLSWAYTRATKPLELKEA